MHHTTVTSQRGAALIVALIMLVIMTMLGLTTMNTSIMEERMAGNTRSRELAFEAAEAAVRESENKIVEGRYYETTPKDGSIDGLYEPLLDADPDPDPDDDADTPDWWYQGEWWDPVGDDTANWQAREAETGVGDLGGPAAAPQYVSEYLDFFTRDINCGADIQAASTQDCYRYAYRVTGRGWGLNTNALAIVQSIFADRK